jgi:hypothetical protein
MAVQLPADDVDIPFTHPERFGQKLHQFGIGFAFHWRRLNADFQGVAV